MPDLLAILTTALLFALAIAYTHGCARLKAGRP